MKKKLLSVALALAMALSLAACGGTTAPEAPADSSTAPASETGTTEGAEQTLRVAAIETAYGAEMWQQIAAAFEAANPGVTVELTTDKMLEDVIGPGMKAGDYPDVIHLATGRELALTETFIKDNAIEEITDVLSMQVPGESVTVGDKIAGGFTDTSLTNPYGDGKTYLAPMFYSPCGLFFNAALMREKGWDVPTTWDEMWELGDKAAAEGIALFAYPTTGYFDALFFALLYEVGGADFFESAMAYEEGIWETPEAQTAFDIVAKLAQYTEKSVPSNATDDSFMKNQQLLLDGQALFLTNGTWLPGEMADAPGAGEFEYGFMALPAVSAGGDRYSFTWFEQCWIPAGAENKDLAKQFIAYLYSDEAVAIFANTGGAVQPVIGVADLLAEDQKLYYSIYDDGAKAALGGWAATDPVEGIDNRAVWFDPVNSLVSGDKTEQDWVEGIIAASDRLREALK